MADIIKLRKEVAFYTRQIEDNRRMLREAEQTMQEATRKVEDFKRELQESEGNLRYNQRELERAERDENAKTRQKAA